LGRITATRRPGFPALIGRLLAAFPEKPEAVSLSEPDLFTLI
jgi:hypothetical protein